MRRSLLPLALVFTMVMMVAAPAQAQTDNPEFLWDAEIVEVFEADCRDGFTDIRYATCEIDGHGVKHLGTIGVGIEADRLFMRVFVDDSFVATDLYVDREANGLGRLTAAPGPRTRPPVDLPYDGHAICALYDEKSSFITHECILNLPGFEGTRVFVGHHEWQLFASARVPGLGWVAGTVWPDQTYLPGGRYYR